MALRRCRTSRPGNTTSRVVAPCTVTGATKKSGPDAADRSQYRIASTSQHPPRTGHHAAHDARRVRGRGGRIYKERSKTMQKMAAPNMKASSMAWAAGSSGKSYHAGRINGWPLVARSSICARRYGRMAVRIASAALTPPSASTPAGPYLVPKKKEIPNPSQPKKEGVRSARYARGASSRCEQDGS